MNQKCTLQRLYAMLKSYSLWVAMLFMVCCTVTGFAQTVRDGAGNLLYTLQNGVLYDAVSKPLLTIRGNLVFKGASEHREDIVLLVGTDNLFADKSTNTLGADMQTAKFTLGKGGFYLPNRGLVDEYLIAYYSKGSKGEWLLLAGQPAITMASLQGDDWTTGELVAVFYLINAKHQLTELLTATLGTNVLTNKNPTTTQGTLRRMWNTGDDDFSWDGNMLKRRWNSFDYEEWEFDGRVLRRVWYDDGVEYEWDGKILKRRFNANTEEFEWDGRILRRRWNTGNDEFIIQGNVVKRVWDTGNDEWEMAGDIPIPVIAMIVFGLIRK